MSDGIPMPAKPAKVYAVPARPGLVNDMREWELIGTTTWMPDTIAEQIGSARHQVDGGAVRCPGSHHQPRVLDLDRRNRGLCPSCGRSYSLDYLSRVIAHQEAS